MRSAHYLALVGGIASVTADIVSSEVNCATAIGYKSVFPVGTTTVASTSTIMLSDATTTTAVTDTITEPAVTATTTETEQVTITTTEPTVTDTYTSTSTETATETSTTTESQTVTETETTTTTTTATSNIAAPSGFRPIADTVNGFPAQKLRRNARHPHCRPKMTSSIAAYATTTTALETTGKDCGLAPVPTQYPESVECTATVTEQSTATETTTVSTTVTPAPVTSTETTTITSTSTENPRAETTVTTTETTTTTATATTTETGTVTTTETATATANAVVYDACSASNLLGPSFNGQQISNVYNGNNGNVGGGSIYDNAQAASAYDCCVQCINKDGCTGTAYANGRCVLLHNQARTCGNDQSANPAAFVTSSGATGYILSNGPCGYQKFGQQ